ncbi:hypothetical protein Taro_014274 [Colocasia esculenta]|uniref:Uncharacterized protein n=1 Tax=Colocasia esculenta TaxID=4460 RepID=A0A843UE99_COLES|nr:hypothetical protein [Colocasia esculenta]
MYPCKDRDGGQSERDRFSQGSRRVGQVRLPERDAGDRRVQKATGGIVAISPENAAYQAVAFSGPAPESEWEKDNALDCGLELEGQGLELGPAICSRIPLLLGLLSSSSKPQQLCHIDFIS